MKKSFQHNVKKTKRRKFFNSFFQESIIPVRKIEVFRINNEYKMSNSVRINKRFKNRGDWLNVEFMILKPNY